MGIHNSITSYTTIKLESPINRSARKVLNYGCQICTRNGSILIIDCISRDWFIFIHLPITGSKIKSNRTNKCSTRIAIICRWRCSAIICKEGNTIRIASSSILVASSSFPSTTRISLNSPSYSIWHKVISSTWSFKQTLR